MVKAVIFDLDGVIVSTDELHYRAWKYMTDREGIPFDRKINNRLRGVSRSNCLAIILENSTKIYDDQQKKELMKYKNDFYVKLLDGLTCSNVLPNVMPLLRRLRNDGVKIAVGSSSKNTKKILEKIRLSDAFDAVVDGTEIKRSKPDPEIFLVAAKKLHEQPENCIVVEDAVAGIQAAKAANMIAVGVSDATNCELADYRVDDILEVAEIVRGLS
jgi:beta-phosphoglucomutase